jgi:exoribonuclease-2
LRTAPGANSFAEHDVAAIYRVQSSGKVRLSVHPESHDALGVASYAWMTSPLRRYVDLLNQRQLVAVLAGSAASGHAHLGSVALCAAGVRGCLTPATTSTSEFSKPIGRCAGWYRRTQREITGTVVRENLIRLDGLPLAVRVPSLPPLDSDTPVRLAVDEIDLIECKGHWRWLPPDAEVSRQSRRNSHKPSPKVPKIAPLQDLEGDFAR